MSAGAAVMEWVAPGMAVECGCERPLVYLEEELWGLEEYCARCGRALPGTGERRRWAQLAVEPGQLGAEVERTALPAGVRSRGAASPPAAVGAAPHNGTAGQATCQLHLPI